MTETIHRVTEPSELAAAAERMASCPVLGVDTESDSMHCYFEKVCFVQVKAGDDIYLIDTIRLRDLDPIAAVFADPGVVKVLHGADYDVLCLDRDFGLRFAGLFDTMIAAQFIGRSALGLAALCQEFFDVELDKSLTRHNWALRPVEEKYVHYLVEDVRYLPRLREFLDQEIDAADLREEFELELRRLAGLEWSERPFDPEGWRKIRGSRELDAVGRRVLKALYLMRDEASRERDLPPFKVLNNEALVALARRRPRNSGELESGRRRSRMHRELSEGILEAVRRGVEGEIEMRPPVGPPPPEVLARGELSEALRKWRAERARKEKRPSVVILPKHALEEIVERRPSSLDELRGVPFLGDRRAERYGAEILEIVAAAD